MTTSPSTRPSFRRDVARIALPITIQAVVMSALTMTDQLMVGRLGMHQIASVGIVAQLVNLFMFVLMAIGTTLSVYAAQAWGRGDTDRLHHLLRYGLLGGGALAVVLAGAALAVPDLLMAPFTADGSVIATGTPFLRIVALATAPLAVTIIYSSLLRATGDTRTPMVASATAAVVNVVLDWALIFGHLGLPEMGLRGAALGTLIARVLEAAIVVGRSQRAVSPLAVRSLADLRGAAPAGLLAGIVGTGTPLLLNELQWVLGENAYAVVYGRMGTESLTAMTMNYPLIGLSIGLLTGISGATAVLVGHRLGASAFADAASAARRLIVFAMAASAGVGLLVALASPLYFSVFNAPDHVKELGRLCLVVFCLYLPIKVGNMVTGNGVLVAAGQTAWQLRVETSATWLIGVPLAIVGAFVLHWPIWAVYALLSVEEAVRLALGLRRVGSGVWLRRLERGDGEPAPVPAPSA